MTLMPPGEHLDGTTAERAHLHLLLACFRASPPPMRLPEVTGHPLPELLGTGTIDPDVFRTGHAVMAARYEQIGIRALLPLERVWAGTRSAAGPGTARSHGGFHHPAQGYRHIQMDAAVTVSGDLTGQTPASPQAAALDLVRSYAHDCLHYATFRRYRLTDRGEIARVQYGINFRQPDGRTYSAPDVPGDGPTRNLGIVIEGATDAEATAIARQAAQSCGITSANPAGHARAGFRGRHGHRHRRRHRGRALVRPSLRPVPGQVRQHDHPPVPCAPECTRLQSRRRPQPDRRRHDQRRPSPVGSLAGHQARLRQLRHDVPRPSSWCRARTGQVMPHRAARPRSSSARSAR